MSVSKAYCMDFERKDVSNSQYFLFLYRLQYFSFFLFFLLPFLFLYAQKVPLFLSNFRTLACRSSPRFCDIVNVCLFSEFAFILWFSALALDLALVEP